MRVHLFSVGRTLIASFSFGKRQKIKAAPSSAKTVLPAVPSWGMICRPDRCAKCHLKSTVDGTKYTPGARVCDPQELGPVQAFRIKECGPERTGRIDQGLLNIEGPATRTTAPANWSLVLLWCLDVDGRTQVPWSLYYLSVFTVSARVICHVPSIFFNLKCISSTPYSLSLPTVTRTVQLTSAVCLSGPILPYPQMCNGPIRFPLKIIGPPQKSPACEPQAFCHFSGPAPFNEPF